MVLPLVDQHRPKCHLCNRTFESVEKMRQHQEADHKDFVDFHKKREPAPGDVTVF